MPPSTPVPADTSSCSTLKSLVSSKFVVPRGNRRAVERRLLLARMLEERRRRCFVLQSPAGYGKTTMLASWCRALAAFGFDVAWLSLDEEDSDPAIWLDYLLASVAKVDPAIAQEAMMFEGVGAGFDPDGVERSVIALVRRIAARRRELVIVFDDLHHVTAPGILEALQWLLDYAPANLHLAFASRGPIPLSLDRLRAEDLTVELSLGDLRFTPEEAEQFLKSQLGEVDAASAKRLNDLTDGWVSGLQLFSLSLKGKRHGATSAYVDMAIQEQIRDARTFAHYFEREVLARLAPAELDLLTRAAVCDRFCASLCATLRGESLDRAAAAQLLERLESDNLFVVPLNRTAVGTWYRLHPLLRETLLDRVNGWSEGARRALHAQAWPWFLEQGFLGEAVHHVLKSGDPTRAAELIERHASSLYARGELRALIALVRQLPSEVVQNSLNLRMWMARQQLYHAEYDACAASLDALCAALPTHAASDRFNVVVLRAVLAIQSDDADSAILLLPQLLDPPAGADAIAIGGCSNVLSWIYMQRGEYERARNLQISETTAPEVDGAPLLGTAAGVLTGRCLVGLSYSLEGRMTQAERLYRSVLREAERHGRSCNHPAIVAATLLGEVLYEQNQNVAARELLESRADVFERISIPDVAMRGMLVLSGTRWAAGHRLEAFAWLDRLEEYATAGGLRRLLGVSLATQVHRHLLLGAHSTAQACLARLWQLDEERPPNATGTFNGVHFAARASAIRMQIATGDFELAALALDQMIAYCDAHGRQGNVAYLRLQRAIVDTRLGRQPAAHANVVAALRLGHRLGLLRSLVDAGESALDLITEVARSEPLDPVIAFYVERLQAARPAEEAPDVQSGNAKARRREAMPGVKALSEREIDVFRLLATALSTKKIARALSLSPETVKWHLTNIYAKLRVSGRDELVERVRDLGWDGYPDDRSHSGVAADS